MISPTWTSRISFRFGKRPRSFAKRCDGISNQSVFSAIQRTFGRRAHSFCMIFHSSSDRSQRLRMVFDGDSRLFRKMMISRVQGPKSGTASAFSRYCFRAFCSTRIRPMARCADRVQLRQTKLTFRRSWSTVCKGKRDIQEASPSRSVCSFSLRSFARISTNSSKRKCGKTSRRHSELKLRVVWVEATSAR